MEEEKLGKYMDHLNVTDIVHYLLQDYIFTMWAFSYLILPTALSYIETLTFPF